MFLSYRATRIRILRPIARPATRTVHQQQQHSLLVARKDHDEVRAMISKLKGRNLDNDQRQRLFNDMVKTIAQHDAAEEVLIYRTAGYISGHKAQLAVDQTIAVEKLLYDMDQKYGHKIDEAGFHERLEALEKELNKHLSMEENELFPLLEQGLKEEEIGSLNHWFERLKPLAPTRPHPDGPHSAVGKLATGPVVKFLDTLRDLTKSFQAKTETTVQSENN